jgi:hypothetical protein
MNWAVRKAPIFPASEEGSQSGGEKVEEKVRK